MDLDSNWTIYELLVHPLCSNPGWQGGHPGHHQVAHCARVTSRGDHQVAGRLGHDQPSHGPPSDRGTNAHPGVRCDSHLDNCWRRRYHRCWGEIKRKLSIFPKCGLCTRHPLWTTCRTQIPILRTHLGPRNVLFLFGRWFMLWLISQIAPMYKLTPDHWEYLRMICIKFGWEMSFQFTLVESNASMRAQARFSIHQSSQ